MEWGTPEEAAAAKAAALARVRIPSGQQWAAMLPSERAQVESTVSWLKSQELADWQETYKKMLPRGKTKKGMV